MARPRVPSQPACAFPFRCPRRDRVFEAVRSFAEAADPARCPRDGAPAGRLFSPPADVLVRGGFRDSLDPEAAAAHRPTWSHDDLSCHTHEPGPAESEHGEAYRHAHQHDHGHAHDHGRHGRGHAHPH